MRLFPAPALSHVLVVLTVTGGALLAGCTSSYTATAGATGDDIYRDACVRCHRPLTEDPDHLFELSVDKMNAEYLVRRIHRGGVGMPGFPNIQGAELEALTGYVLARSRVRAD
jgi:cytochrome c551